MRILQYVYFALSSESVTAAAITDALGLAPDVERVRGSRRSSPPVPVQHSWQIHCDHAGLAVDDLVERVLQRVLPFEEKIRQVVASGQVTAVLEIVRDFDAEGGEEEADGEVVTPWRVRMTKLSGQHQLLGWHLDAATLAFLVRVGASVDCDEYG